MPVEPRSTDEFTKGNLLLGFSQVEFTPLNADGTFGTAVPLGILSGEELAKEVTVLELPDGSAGTITVAREILSSLKPSFNLETFNFRADIAQYIFGAEQNTPITANSAATVTNEALTVPTSASSDQVFQSLVNGEIDSNPATQTLTCAQVTETITGDTTVNYQLAFKPLLLADVDNGTTLEFTETVTATGALVTTYTVIVGAPAGAGQAQLTVGTGSASGVLLLNDSVPVANQLNLIYTPSHDLVEDFDALDPDMLLDSLLGRIRFPNIDSFAAPDATSAIRQGQALEFDYTFNQNASTSMQPFTQGGGSFQGKATIKHLPDVGVNFIWTVPSVTIHLTDDSLTFGSDDFVTGTIEMILNDAGGTDRFGTMLLSTESESA